MFYMVGLVLLERNVSSMWMLDWNGVIWVLLRSHAFENKCRMYVGNELNLNGAIWGLLRSNVFGKKSFK